MKYWLTILCIIIISYPLVAQEDVKTTKTPVIESSPNVEARYPGGRIELFGIKFKDPLVLCQILIALMMTIAFVQSGVDKLIDREGNLVFFESHFANTPLKSVADVGLSIFNHTGVNGRRYVRLWCLLCHCRKKYYLDLQWLAVASRNNLDPLFWPTCCQRLPGRCRSGALFYSDHAGHYEYVLAFE